MTNYLCENCKFPFNGEDKEYCPRCNSKRIKVVKERKDETAGALPQEQKPHVYRDPMIVGDTKSSWAAFHSSEQRDCAECHGTEFEMDWKHRQKICKKCGSVFGLKRNR